MLKLSPKFVSVVAFLFISLSAIAAEGGYHQVAKYDVGWRRRLGLPHRRRFIESSFHLPRYARHGSRH